MDIIKIVIRAFLRTHLELIFVNSQGVLWGPSGDSLGILWGPSWGPSGDPQESSSWGPLRRGPKVEQMRAGSIKIKIPRGPKSAINRSREGLGLIDLSVVALIQS